MAEQYQDFEIWCPTLDIQRKDSVKTPGYDPAESAKWFAEACDHVYDMFFTKSPEATVHIKGSKMTTVKVFRITVEMRPIYHSEEV